MRLAYVVITTLKARVHLRLRALIKIIWRNSWRNMILILVL